CALPICARRAGGGAQWRERSRMRSSALDRIGSLPTCGCESRKKPESSIAQALSLGDHGADFPITEGVFVSSGNRPQRRGTRRPTPAMRVRACHPATRLDDPPRIYRQWPAAGEHCSFQESIYTHTLLSVRIWTRHADEAALLIVLNALRFALLDCAFSECHCMDPTAFDDLTGFLVFEVGRTVSASTQDEKQRKQFFHFHSLLIDSGKAYVPGVSRVEWLR